MTDIARIVLGDDPKLRRLLAYWSAAAILYGTFVLMLRPEIEAGNVFHMSATMFSWLALANVLLSYALVRSSDALRITPLRLAFIQALQAVYCIIGAYGVTGPVRGASLMVMLVVVVFCAFSLRPRQTLLLCGVTLAGAGATMLWLTLHYPLRFPPLVEAIHFAVLTVSLLSIALLTGEMSKLRSRLKQQKEELLAALATIRKLATIDELTSLANRRHMNEVLCDQERRAGIEQRTVCIALLDIDFFKNVNDRYGHAAGDAVLRTFAEAARAELRNGDVLARWGGEEFLLMLPATELDEAMRVVQRMAERVGAMTIPDLAAALRITFSGGLVARARGELFADTINRADKAMYVAKSTGRDRVVLA